MKPLLLLLLALLPLPALSQIPIITCKGGLISTRAALPHGGDFVLHINPNNSRFTATTSVDGNLIEGFTGTVDSKLRLSGYSTLFGYPITGRLRVKGAYFTFVGRINGGALQYRVQASDGIFP